MLSVPGEYWWRLESETLDGIAFGILYNHTDDRELAELRAKAFALEILGPLTAPAMIVESTIDSWLMAGPRRPASVRRRAPDSLTVRCARCPTDLPVAGRHFGLLSVFGTLCDRCREVPA